jgi:hypothetical protein
MSLIQRLQESDEVLAVVIAAGLSAVIAIFRWFVTPRGRVKWAISHQHTFLTYPIPPPPQPQLPTTVEQGAQGAPAAASQPTQPVLVYTRTIWVQNVGRATVNEAEIMFSNRPHHFEIWPQRQYTEAVNPAGNLMIKLDWLSRREWVTIVMLNVGVLPPLVTNIRWNGGVAREAPMAPQEVAPRWLRSSLVALMLSGVVFWVYVIVRLILWKIN